MKLLLLENKDNHEDHMKVLLLENEKKFKKNSLCLLQRFQEIYV